MTKSALLWRTHSQILRLELSKTVYIWSGTAKKPVVTVKDGTDVLSASNYTVTYADGRKNVGNYKVKVKMKGNYSGKKTVTFKINPKGTKITSLTAGNWQFTVRWDKQASETTGYQIQFSRDSSFKSGTTITVKVTNPKQVKKVIKGRKTGKKYYVRIRTYKVVNSKTFYSDWSTVKSVTVK